jgi:hypothetical protein
VKVDEVAGTAWYVEPASIELGGELRRVSVVQDLAAEESGGIRSRLVTYEVDCRGERLRSVSGTEHAQPMAQGKPARRWERESDWLYVAPRTGSHLASRGSYRSIVRFVCAR